jgi:hypothetical protein
VSRNDLLAERIGTALGSACALFGEAAFRRLLAGFGTAAARC